MPGRQIEQRPRVADLRHQRLEFIERFVVARQHVERRAGAAGTHVRSCLEDRNVRGLLQPVIGKILDLRLDRDNFGGQQRNLSTDFVRLARQAVGRRVFIESATGPPIDRRNARPASARAQLIEIVSFVVPLARHEPQRQTGPHFVHRAFDQRQQSFDLGPVTGQPRLAHRQPRLDRAGVQRLLQTCPRVLRACRLRETRHTPVAEAGLTHRHVSCQPHVVVDPDVVGIGFGHEPVDLSHILLEVRVDRDRTIPSTHCRRRRSRA